MIETLWEINYLVKDKFCKHIKFVMRNVSKMKRCNKEGTFYVFAEFVFDQIIYFPQGFNHFFLPT
jgi:hypothetical protein